MSRRHIHCLLQPQTVLSALIVLLAHTTQAQSESTNAPTRLPDVVVVGSAPTQTQSKSYSTTNATTALKLDVPLLETPQAVSVVSRALMVDQGAHKLDDVLKNVAGVNFGNCYGEWDGYRIRGFDVSLYNTYIDGLIGLGATGEEIWGIEQAEVVKGPASSLYGQGPLGGLLNLVTKRPKPEASNEARLTVGSFNYYEAAFDINAPLNQDGTVYGRLNALYRQNDSFVDYAGAQRLYVAPALTWEPTPDTSLTLLTSVKDDRIDIAFPLPAHGTVQPNTNGDISINRYIGNPAYGNDEWERDTRLGYELKHRFNEHFSLRNNIRYERIDWTSDDLSYPSVLQADDRTLELSGFRADGFYEGYRVDGALDSRFETGPVEHTLTTGVDYRWTKQNYQYQSSTNLVTIDLFNPNYGAMPAYLYDVATSYANTDTDVGFYVQEHARFWEKFTLTAGGRFDRSSSGNDSANAFSPRVGLTYDVTPELAAYANYSRSFEPQWGYVDAGGKNVKPSTGENFEVGLKASFWEDRLHGLLAVYQLTKQNVATPDLSTANPFDSTLSGEQRSRGVELEGGYRFAPGVEFTAAYTYMNAEIVSDNSIPVGTKLQGAPEHSFNAWLKYTLQDGPLQGLGFGLGGRYYTRQQADASYSSPFDLPAFGVMDAALYYERGRLHAQLNVNNLLDERYFVGSYDSLYVLPGEPLNVRASVSWSF